MQDLEIQLAIHVTDQELKALDLGLQNIDKTVAALQKEAQSFADQLVHGLDEASDSAKAFANDLPKGLFASLEAELTSLKEAQKNAFSVDEAKAYEDEIQRVEKEYKKLNEDVKGTKAPKGIFTGLEAELETLKKKQHEALSVTEAQSYTAQIKKVEKSLKDLNSEVEHGSGKFQQFAGNLKDSLSSLPIAGLAAGGGIAALVSGLGNAITIGAQFQSGVAELGAITGATGEKLQGLATDARSLAKEFGTGAGDQLTTYKTILSRLGPEMANDSAALATMARNVNILSQATGDSAEASIDALSTSILQMGIDLKDPAVAAAAMTEQMNIMAAGAQAGASEVPQISEALKNAGVAMKSANVSFLEGNAALQTLAGGGKVGSEAGVALRNVIGLLQKQSGPGAAALKEMGLSVEQLGETLTTKGLNSALELVQGGLNTLGSDAEKNAARMKLFGIENSTTAGILLDGTEKTKAFADAIASAPNAAFDQAAVRSETFSQALARGQSAVEDIGISLFESLAPALTIAANVLGKVTDIAGALFSGPLGTGVAVIGALAAATVAYNLVSQLSLATKVAEAVADTRKLVLGQAEIAMNAAKTIAVGIYTGSITAATIATTILNAVTALNPFVAVGIAVAAAAVIFFAFGGTLQDLADIASKAFTGIESFFGIISGTEAANNNAAIAVRNATEAFGEYQAAIGEVDAKLKGLNATDDVVANFEKLSAQTTLTAEDQDAYNLSLNALVKRYPEAISGVNAATGAYNVNLEKVKELQVEQLKFANEDKAKLIRENLIAPTNDLVAAQEAQKNQLQALRKALDEAIDSKDTEEILKAKAAYDEQKKSVADTDKQLRLQVETLIKSGAAGKGSAAEVAKALGLEGAAAAKVTPLVKSINDELLSQKKAADDAAHSVEGLAKKYDDVKAAADGALDATKGAFKQTLIDLETAKKSGDSAAVAAAQKKLKELKDTGKEQVAEAKHFKEIEAQTDELFNADLEKKKKERGKTKQQIDKDNFDKAQQALEDANNKYLTTLDLAVADGTKKESDAQKLRLESARDYAKGVADLASKYNQFDGKYLLDQAKAIKDLSQLEIDQGLQAIETVKTARLNALEIEIADGKKTEAQANAERIQAELDYQNAVLEFSRTNNLELGKVLVDQAKARLESQKQHADELGKAYADAAAPINLEWERTFKAIDLLHLDEQKKFEVTVEAKKQQYDELRAAALASGALEELKALDEQRAQDIEASNFEQNALLDKQLDSVREKYLSFKLPSLIDVKEMGLDTLKSSLEGLVDGLNESFFKPLEKSLGAQKSIWGSFAASVIESVVQIVEQLVIQYAISLAAGLLFGASVAGTMAGIAAAAATPAALVSTATLGGAAVAGGAALAATVALAKGIALNFNGSIVDEPTLTMIGEGWQPEFIIPERTADTILREKFDQYGGGMGGFSKEDLADAVSEGMRRNPIRGVASGRTLQLVNQKTVNIQRLRS